jgi:hypothetical protein
MPSQRWLACYCLALGVLVTAPAAAQWEASTPTASGWLRLSVDDAVYTALGPQALERLRIVDSQGREQAFAVCAPQQPTRPVKVTVPVLPLNVGSRVHFDAAGNLTRQGGPGVEALPPWTDWVLDLRDHPQDLLTIQLPPAMDVSRVQLRSSPNAQQWSRPLPFEAQGQTLTLGNPETITLLRIDIDGGIASAPPALDLGMRSHSSQTALHWFGAGVPSGEATRVQRPYGIQGARLSQVPAALKALTLASRLSPRDAWKSRGQWQAGAAPPVLRLAAVGDREWRLQTQPEGLKLNWELAHVAHELRLPPALSLPLRVDIGSKPSQQLRCDDRRWQGDFSTLTLHALSDTSAAAPPPVAKPGNIRPWFLLLVAAIAGALWWVKRRH